MLFSNVIKLFKKGNVCVTGLRGTGKDLLMGNVIVRRKKEYVSNLEYDNKGLWFSLDYSLIDLGKNSFKDLLEGNVKYYKYTYPQGSDIYISDVGCYFPSQYCNELNRDYKYLPLYMALSRQVSHNNVHINVQNLNRAWDKIREQSDTYIRCRKCIYIFGFVIQFITIYDKYQSCVDRVSPCRIHEPLFADKEVRTNVQMYRDKFFNQYGSVKNKILIYFNRSKHDTYYFEKLFERGIKK